MAVMVIAMVMVTVTVVISHLCQMSSVLILGPA